MQESFKDKDENSLEKGVLYDLPSQSWPLSFQGYEYHQEGDFKPCMREAVFSDFKGYPHYFNRKKIEIIASKTTPEKIREYVDSAKTLVDWLSIKENQMIAQSRAKCTDQSSQKRQVYYADDLQTMRDARRD